MWVGLGLVGGVGLGFVGWIIRVCGVGWGYFSFKIYEYTCMEWVFECGGLRGMGFFGSSEVAALGGLTGIASFFFLDMLLEFGGA